MILLVITLGLWQTYNAAYTKITDTHKFSKGFKNSNLCGFLMWSGMILNIYIIN